MDGEQRERLDKWIEANWRHGPCPVCQANDWQVDTDLAQLMIYPLARTTYPTLVIRCKTCGHLLLFNAIHAGILDQPKLVTGDAGVDPPLPDPVPQEPAGD